jgi:hypothetical protein
MKTPPGIPISPRLKEISAKGPSVQLIENLLDAL